MAHHYSPRDFLRQAPNRLLAEYFRRKGLESVASLCAREETEVQDIWKAWDALGPAVSAPIDAEFQVVDEMANEFGVQAVIEEGRSYHDEDLEPTFADMPGFYDKALWTFLHRPRIFQVASQFRRADEFSARYWHKRIEQVPKVEPRDDESACHELAEAIGSYFQLAQGRGRSCEVEVYRRDSRYYYFCFAEDYGRTQVEFDERLARRAHRPAFEVIFVYSPASALDIHFPGPKKVREELEQIFGRVVLGTELPGLGRDERVYNLNALKDRRFDFVYPPGSGLTDVCVKEVRLTVLGWGFRRLTLEADPNVTREAVYELLDQVLQTAPSVPREAGRIPLSLCNITRLSLQAKFQDAATGKPSTRTFHLTYPNSCDLGQYGRDLVLRDMLVASGLEPQRAQLRLEE
jgi:hypothetical protein